MISAINAKTLKVDFSKALSNEDKAKLTFNLKKGVAPVPVDVKFLEGDTSAELSRNVAFAAGTYKLVVSLDGKEIGSNDLEIQAEKATSIEIVNTTIEKNAAAKLNYKVLNQYKEEMKPSPEVNAVVVNKTNAARVATVAAFPNVNTNGCDLGDELQFTLVLKADPTVKATKVVTVSAKVIDKLTFGEAVYPEGQTAARRGDKVLFDIKAFMGEDEIALTQENHTTDTATTEGLVPMFDAEQTVKINADGKLEVTVANTAKAGKKTISYVDPNGNVYPVSYTVQLVKAIGLEAVTIPDAQVQANGTTKVKFDVLLDNGEKLKDADLIHPDFTDLKINITKKDTTDAVFTAPTHDSNITIADILKAIDITAAAAPNKKDVLTFTLKDGDTAIGEKVDFDIETVTAITAYTVKLTENLLVVPVGTEVALKVEADQKYTFTAKKVKITFDTVEYFVENVPFVKGVATVKFTPNKVSAANTITVDVDSIGGVSTDRLQVTLGDVTAFKVSTTDKKAFKVEAVNKLGMLVNGYTETVILNFSANPVMVFDSLPSGQKEVTFAAGAGTVTLTTAAVPAGTTITVTGGGFTGSYTVE